MEKIEDQKITINEEELFNKGYEAYQAEKYDEAIRWFKNVIAMNPNSVKAYYNIGLTFYKKQMLDESIAFYKKALDVYPDYAPAHNNLGVSYLDKGKDDLASEHFYKAGLLFHREGFEEEATNAYKHLKRTGSKKLEQDLFKKLYPEGKQKKGNVSK